LNKIDVQTSVYTGIIMSLLKMGLGYGPADVKQICCNS